MGTSATRGYTSPPGNPEGVLKKGEDALKLTNSDWEKRLTPEQYHVCREKGTEVPFTGHFVNHSEQGIYTCACCGAALFNSGTKFDAGCGWPSFYDDYKEHKGESNVIRRPDTSGGMTRTEIICKSCGSHLGHVFDDGPKPTGERFCVNSVSLGFKKKTK